jgi:glycosyltransferase involved in cell wall biosynthesis
MFRSKIQSFKYLFKKIFFEVQIRGWFSSLVYFSARIFPRLEQIPFIKPLFQVNTLIIDLNINGFVEKAISDLRNVVDDGKSNRKVIDAAWALACFYADRGTEHGANECNRMLQLIKKRTKRKLLLLRASILEAECRLVLDRTKEASKILEEAMKNGNSQDLLISYANLFTCLKQKESILNKIFQKSSLFNIILPVEGSDSVFDKLAANQPEKSTVSSNRKPLVSILLPTYNSAATLHCALNSLQCQTWENIEIIIIDDCSTDNTKDIVRIFQANDHRIKFIQTPENQGAYFARNMGLQLAKGEYVTCHDSDDWSHPQKIEVQATHLHKNKETLGNTSRWIRANNNLQFSRSNLAGYYIHDNLSSFMFRREYILSHFGYWDSVRFSADDEMIRRIRKREGIGSIINIPTPPLSFGRIMLTSLTNNSAFGYYGYQIGARKEYIESASWFSDNFPHYILPFPIKERPFPVPRPLLPQFKKDAHNRFFFNLIVAYDFRSFGGQQNRVLSLIKNSIQSGHKTGLIQMNRYGYPNLPIHSDFRQHIDGKRLSMIVWGENATCDQLIIPDPHVLDYSQNFIPSVTTKSITIGDTPYSCCSDLATLNKNHVNHIMSNFSIIE